MEEEIKKIALLKKDKIIKMDNPDELKKINDFLMIVSNKGWALKLPMDTVLSMLHYIDISDDKLLDYYQKLISIENQPTIYTLIK